MQEKERAREREQDRETVMCRVVLTLVGPHERSSIKRKRNSDGIWLCNGTIKGGVKRRRKNQWATEKEERLSRRQAGEGGSGGGDTGGGAEEVTFIEPCLSDCPEADFDAVLTVPAKTVNHEIFPDKDSLEKVNLMATYFRVFSSSYFHFSSSSSFSSASFSSRPTEYASCTHAHIGTHNMK